MNLTPHTFQFRGIAFTLCLTFALQLSTFGQGSLTPPGPPAPTMKTLDQVQPRTAITNLPFTIAASGSYYFVTNLVGVGGININADNVTVDLNGFTLGGVPGSASGVFLSGVHSNICLRNGIIANRAGLGVDAAGAVNSKALELQLSGNALDGLVMGTGSLVEGCTVRNSVAGIGITTGDNSVVRDCVSTRNGGHGMYVAYNSLVTGCAAALNGGNGILGRDQVQVLNTVATQNGCVGIGLGAQANIRNCVCASNIVDGISTGSNSAVDGCAASRNSNRGIFVADGSSISGCVANTNAGIGLRATDYCVIRDSSSFGNASFGIQLTSYGHVRGCISSLNSNFAVDINTGSSATDCIVEQNGSVGINTQNRCVVRGCHITGNNFDGIRITADCSVIDNESHDNNSGSSGVDGLYVTGDRNHIEGNVLRGNGGYGIRLNGVSNCVIIKNDAKGNVTGPYALGVGVNDVGPLGTAAASTSPWANIQ